MSATLNIATVLFVIFYPLKKMLIQNILIHKSGYPDVLPDKSVDKRRATSHKTQNALYYQTVSRLHKKMTLHHGTL